MRYSLRQTSAFKRDYKRAKKRGYDMGLLAEAIRILQSGEPMPEHYHDHPLAPYNKKEVTPRKPRKTPPCRGVRLITDSFGRGFGPILPSVGIVSCLFCYLLCRGKRKH